MNAICRTKNSEKTKLQEDPEAEQKLNEILFGGDNSTVLDTSYICLFKCFSFTYMFLSTLFHRYYSIYRTCSVLKRVFIFFSFRVTFKIDNIESIHCSAGIITFLCNDVQASRGSNSRPHPFRSNAHPLDYRV